MNCFIAILLISIINITPNNAFNINLNNKPHFLSKATGNVELNEKLSSSRSHFFNNIHNGQSMQDEASSKRINRVPKSGMAQKTFHEPAMSRSIRSASDELYFLHSSHQRKLPLDHSLENDDNSIEETSSYNSLSDSSDEQVIINDYGRSRKASHSGNGLSYRNTPVIQQWHVREIDTLLPHNRHVSHIKYANGGSERVPITAISPSHRDGSQNAKVLSPRSSVTDKSLEDISIAELYSNVDSNIASHDTKSRSKNNKIINFLQPQSSETPDSLEDWNSDQWHINLGPFINKNHSSVFSSNNRVSTPMSPVVYSFSTKLGQASELRPGLRGIQNQLTDDSSKQSLLLNTQNLRSTSNQPVAGIFQHRPPQSPLLHSFTVNLGEQQKPKITTQTGSIIPFKGSHITSATSTSRRANVNNGLLLKKHINPTIELVDQLDSEEEIQILLALDRNDFKRIFT